MSWTLLLALMAIALAGILHGAGFLIALLSGIIAKVKCTATLGVEVLDYLPYTFFNYINAIVAVAMANFGVGLLQSKTSPTSTESCKFKSLKPNSNYRLIKRV